MRPKLVNGAISFVVAFAIEVGLYPVISEGIDDAPVRVLVRFVAFAGSFYGMYKILGMLDKRLGRGR